MAKTKNPPAKPSRPPSPPSAPSPSTRFIGAWLQAVACAQPNVSVFTEQTGSRKAALATLKKLIADHFVGAPTILALGGYSKSAQVINVSAARAPSSELIAA